MSRTLTYVGPMQRAQVSLPGRRVTVERNKQYPFTDDEIAHLEPDLWAELAPAPVLTVAEVLAGTAAQVIAEVNAHPERAAELLAGEQAGGKRKTVLVVLERLAADQGGDAGAGDGAAGGTEPPPTTTEAAASQQQES